MAYPKKAKILLTDSLGVLLLILAALLGWLPGPGGVPLLVAGLGLLAINHKWARNLLIKLKKHGVNFTELIFREHPVWRIGIDLISLGLLIGAIVLLDQTEHNFWVGAAISMALLALGLFMGNRHRLEKLLKLFKAKA